MGYRIHGITKTVIFAAIIALLSGCVHNSVADFHFLQYSGRKMSFSEEPGVSWKKNREDHAGLLVSCEGGASTPFYRLDETVNVEKPGRAFFIVYYSDTPLQLNIQINRTERSFPMPVMPGKEIEFRVPLNPSDSLDGFRISADSSTGMLDILGTGIDDYYPGMSIGNGQVLIGRGAEPIVGRDGKIQELILDDSIAWAAYMETKNTVPEGFLRLRLESTGKAPAELMFFSRDNLSSRVDFTHSAGKGYYDFHYSVLGFVPDRVQLKAVDARITGVDFLSMKSHSGPVDIDFSSLLMYPRELWRNSDYELFRWSLAPDILVFDFADYKVQSAFLKRMAFFVEKEGVRGTLLQNEVLEPLHGWNAHDYRAEDIARFFTAALNERFTLNPEEEKLASLLVENKIIIRNDEAYAPVSGGFLSITRESPDYLRHLFLTHEGCHGLFFTDSGLREASQALWDGFTPVEQSFWKTFFSWKGYDSEDEYLVVNELQAYLLQQSVAGAAPYYIDYTLPRMMEVYPASKAVVNALLAENPQHFTDAAGVLDYYLSDRWGVQAGNLSHLVFSHN